MRDLYQDVTNRILAAMETAGEWSPPWHRYAGGMPTNATTKARYRGVNVLMLWITGLQEGYASDKWASYKQWQLAGRQVKGGETGTPVVYYGTMFRANDEQPDKDKKIPFLKSSTVFNESQIADYLPPPPPPILDESLRHYYVDAHVHRIGAVIKYNRGFNPCFVPALDEIRMPPFAEFKTAPDYYNTQFHELVHWTGHKDRLNRDLGKRFGKEAYAGEELVAEIGAAFLCAEFGVQSRMRDDHAAYVKQWIKLLKDDKRAIFTAASKASDASLFLVHAGNPTLLEVAADLEAA